MDFLFNTSLIKGKAGLSWVEQAFRVPGIVPEFINDRQRNMWGLSAPRTGPIYPQEDNSGFHLC